MFFLSTLHPSKDICFSCIFSGIHHSQQGAVDSLTSSIRHNQCPHTCRIHPTIAGESPTSIDLSYTRSLLHACTYKTHSESLLIELGENDRCFCRVILVEVSWLECVSLNRNQDFDAEVCLLSSGACFNNHRVPQKGDDPSGGFDT